MCRSVNCEFTCNPLPSPRLGSPAVTGARFDDVADAREWEVKAEATGALRRGLSGDGDDSALG